MCCVFGQDSCSVKKSGAVKHAAFFQIWTKASWNQLCSIIYVDIHYNVYITFTFSCTLLLLSLWQHLENSLHSLPVYGLPFESPVDRQGLFTDQPAIVVYSSWFSPLLIAMALNSLDDCVVPQKRNIAAFYFVTQRERLGHKSTWGEAVVFCPRWLGFIALHKKLIGGPFCVRVNFTTDCVYWSSRKTK